MGGAVLLPLCVVLFLWTCCVSVSADKITIDPNIASPSARPVDPDDDGNDVLGRDQRLDKTITLSAASKPVVTVLTTLGALSGVDMRAGQNQNDWLSRERKMTLYVKDLPLRDLMRSMARVMKYRWRATGGTPDAPRYRFYLDRRAALDAEAEYRRQTERQQRRRAEQRERTLAAMSKTARLAPDEAEALKVSNPFLHALHQTGTASALDSLMSQCPSVADALRSGAELDLTAADLAPSAREAMWKTYTSLCRLEQRMEPSRERQMATAMPDDPRGLVLRINTWGERMGGAESLLFLGDIGMSCEGASSTEFPLLDPDGDTAKLVGKAMGMMAERGAKPEDLARALESEFRDLVGSVFSKAEVGEATVSHAEDPDLARKVRIRPEERGAPEMLRVFARESGFSVVSDSFVVDWGPVRSLVAQDPTVREFLDQYAGATFYNWWRSGSVIELRARNWYEKQSLLIPREWLDAWRKSLRRDGLLCLDDLAQIARLSTKQLKENITDGDDVLRLAGLPWVLEPSRDVLALYGALSPEQAALLRGADGLDLRLLAPEQWELAAKMLSRRRFHGSDDPDVPLRLTVETQPREAGGRQGHDEGRPNPAHHTFTVVCGTGEEATRLVVPVAVPRYEKPAQHEQEGTSRPDARQTQKEGSR